MPASLATGRVDERADGTEKHPTRHLGRAKVLKMIGVDLTVHQRKSPSLELGDQRRKRDLGRIRHVSKHRLTAEQPPHRDTIETAHEAPV